MKLLVRAFLLALLCQQLTSSACDLRCPPLNLLKGNAESGIRTWKERVSLAEQNPSTHQIIAVIDGRYVLPIEIDSHTLEFSFPISHASDLRHSFVLYQRIDSSIAHQNFASFESLDLNCKADCSKATHDLPTASNPYTGILYEGWHAYACQTVLKQDFPPLSIEAIIRSNGQRKISQVYQSPYTPADAQNFYYQSIPAWGPYCIYRKRPGEINPPLPDCVNISSTLTRHANMLYSSGISYVIVDATNLPTYTPFADAIQLRPAQVLAEEWAILRSQGVSVPGIAIWGTVPSGANLYSYFLDSMYNNATIAPLIAKDPNSGKMLFFIVASGNQDQSIIDAIESNGGRNNIITILMWAQFPPSDFSTGKWGFFSPCTSGGAYTNTFEGLSACNQYTTTNSPIGNSITATPSWQMSYASLPGGAPGKLYSKTFQFQFQSAMESNPPNLMISSFNEWIAQPQPNPFGSGYVNSMGLEYDPDKSALWVDTYGCNIARDIEPSVECGNVTYEILRSCLRVWALGNYLRNQSEKFGINSDKLTSCTAAPSEICCLENTSSQRATIWALRRNDGRDFLLSQNPVEVNTLIRSGSWTEVCWYIGPSNAFCVDRSVATTRWALSGGFLMAMQGTALYRCLTSAGTHFFSTDAQCEGDKMESVLGYLVSQRTSEYPRAFYRCYDSAAGVHYHSLDAPCVVGTTEAMYGYVH